MVYNMYTHIHDILFIVTTISNEPTNQVFKNNNKNLKKKKQNTKMKSLVSQRSLRHGTINIMPVKNLNILVKCLGIIKF